MRQNRPGIGTVREHRRWSVIEAERGSAPVLEQTCISKPRPRFVHVSELSMDSEMIPPKLSLALFTVVRTLYSSYSPSKMVDYDPHGWNLQADEPLFLLAQHY